MRHSILLSERRILMDVHTSPVAGVEAMAAVGVEVEGMAEGKI
jgi:hypothetical protein